MENNNCKVVISKDLEKRYLKESFVMVSVGLPKPTFDEWLALRSTGVLKDRNFQKIDAG